MGVTTLQQLHDALCFTSVFTGVTEKPLFKAFGNYVNAGTKEEKYRAYSAFVAEIYKQGESLSDCVKKYVFEDENVYVKAVAKQIPVPSSIQKSVERELATFGKMTSLSAETFAEDMGVSIRDIPTFVSTAVDMQAGYEKRLQNVDKYGYGIFSGTGMFRLSDDKQIEPIVSADKIGMDRFIGYEEERAQVVENTRAFVEGKAPANVLLCGDAGTGKSSTVKAVANAFFDEGVRLIELRKDQLAYLPTVMAKISGNPLKFIIFIDDLSFNKSDDHFSMLKASLEGSASAKADNAVIYATSNRRHIIKESFGDREGDDVHRNDTLQETLSLSERFGLVVLFSKPDKKLYLDIVKTLAKKHGVVMDEKQLEIRAEAFALRKGNRSARCAEQFIDSLR